MFKIEKFEGLVAAPFTPFDKNLNLNTEIIPAYYNFLEKNGIVGAFINGSTGEGVSMTQKERQTNAKKWAECYKNGGKVKIINLVGGTSYGECIENAIFSYEEGLSAIALLAPFYFKPPDALQLAEFIARVGESVPNMPVYFYHIPVLTGVNIPMIALLEHISLLLPNFAGIKFTHEDFMDFLSCLNFSKGRYDLLWGRDECLLSALVLGCKGAVGSTFNYAAPLYHSIISSFNKGNLTQARQLQQKSIDMITLLGKYGGISAGKLYMKYIGLDCGKFRPPVKNISEEMFSSFRVDVKSLNMDGLFSSVEENK